TDDTVRAIYEKHGLDQLTAAGVVSVDALLAQLAVVRSKGYSIDDGETREHMCSFGAPVFDRGPAPAVAGVAISFFKAKLDAATRARGRGGQGVCRPTVPFSWRHPGQPIVGITVIGFIRLGRCAKAGLEPPARL
ncbi:MAG: hypothetical protein EXR04_07140, partial [Rhodospirillales bacterium]|nr:hypothetical protein [Rhodospirillales bacterium]